ncbi:hypothetical protein M422DRAFT_38572 [Sphaerobolus stellatus SS14]|uniref:Major facilitator superfamily (MFS) profile domain-containing protein n=1 Tax=Sphaerobolus stellatus (strain SS14) TaxID=990650 RepID=A0A0C9T9A2_SPHS4|nr:hypothetical protein M422DRAFT_38572 [Sphaerobolus stellatus SS14]
MDDSPSSRSLSQDEHKSVGELSLTKEEPSSQSSDLAAPRPEIKLGDYVFRRHKLNYDQHSIATERSVFDDPVLAPHFRPSPEYENSHRFDPSARWTYKEEKALLRKVDWKVTVWSAISFTALNLDRLNLAQANSDNFLEDLSLTTNDFNLGNTVFLVCFLLAELPSQLISKRVGPDRWIPTQMCMWALVTSSQFWLNGRATFLVCRALLGLLQGGYIADLILYLSYFYKKAELPLRFAFFWMSMQLCNIISALLAFGILRMEGIRGRQGWRWLFLLEGLLTLCIGFATFFRMAPGPTQTKTWYRPKGWFTEREEIILVNRILRDDPTKSDMHNRQSISFKQFLQVACDYDLYPLYLLGLFFEIPSDTPGNYFTLNLRRHGFTTLQTVILGIPGIVASIIAILLVTLLSELVDSRALVAILEDVWALPCLIALYILPARPDRWSYYVAWCSRNAGAVANRTVNASIYNIFVQIGVIVASQIYRMDDAPRYRRGNKILIIICCINVLILYPGTRMYYKWRNSQRDKIWNHMNAEEKAHYLETTKDVGNKRLDFRFAY